MRAEKCVKVFPERRFLRRASMKEKSSGKKFSFRGRMMEDLTFCDMLRKKSICLDYKREPLMVVKN